MKKLIACVVGAVALMATPALANDQVSLRLNWTLSGFHAPFYLGVSRGYYRDEGIDLTIGEGRGGPVVVQAVASGSDTIGMVDASAVITGAVRGIPVRTVMSLMNTSTYAVVARADSGIATPKDLEGKSIAATAGDSLSLLWPAFAKANELDESKINLVMVDPAAKTVATMEGKTQALLGSVDAQRLQLAARGIDTVSLKYADFGVPMVGLTLIATDSTIAEKGDMLERFVRATRKAYEAAIGAPDEAVAAAVAAKPEADGAVLKAQLLAGLENLESANTRGKPIGVASDEDWKTSLTFMQDYAKLSTDKPAEAFYTNAFAD